MLQQGPRRVPAKTLRFRVYPEGPRNIQGCASKNSHRTRGCRAHVEALHVITTVTDRIIGLGAARPCEALGGLGRPEISRDVPAKILTEQGTVHIVEAFDVVTTVKGC